MGTTGSKANRLPPSELVPVIEDIELLQHEPELKRLLEYYLRAERHAVDTPDGRWVDRVMVWDLAEPPQLTRFHGILIAHGWLDARLSLDTFGDADRPRRCYRISREGRRALAWLEGHVDGLDLALADHVPDNAVRPSRDPWASAEPDGWSDFVHG